MKIRKAIIRDIPQIEKINKFGKILNKCSPLDKLDQRRSKSEERNYYKKFIYGKNKWCYVAEEGNKIIGFILFNIEKQGPWYKIKKVGFIDLLFIDKRARRKGVSKLLINKAYEIFKKKNLSYVKLTILTKNPLAHQIWLKYGFKDFRTDMYKRIK